MGVATPLDADLLVIGGGINGAGIARDAAGRGLRVVLCEKDDLAQATSSASTKLIHGGLRYLEHYEFRLVRDSLREREVLMQSAPHIIWPLRFILPHHADLRPRWLIRIGLFLYDHLGGRELLPSSRGVDLRSHPAGGPLKPTFRHGFEYSDCWVQDARLVVLNARDAAARGADIRTRCKCVALEREMDHWRVQVENARTGEAATIAARAVVNAAGPWVSDVLSLDSSTASTHRVRLIKGSHVVVPRLFDHDYPYIFQHADGRVLFAIPYEHDFTLLGTTDTEIQGDPSSVLADRSEVDYICTAVSEYFSQPVAASDVIWSYSGVRPLLDDQAQNASRITRDYVLQLDDRGAPILSVFGGKITTYRKLAEQALDLLAGAMTIGAKPWTAGVALPGGDLDALSFDAFVAHCQQRYPWLDDSLLTDYTRNYGSDINRLLAGRSAMRDLGADFGGGLREAEVDYLYEHEWAQTADDILWRRTKKGLRVSDEDASRLEAWLTARQAQPSSGAPTHASA